MQTTPTDGSPPDSDLAARCGTLLAEASELFRRGEIAASAERALEASSLAGSAMRPDLLAEAALVVEGVPDPSTAAAVDRMCMDALATVGADEIALRARLHGQLAVALHLRERLDDSETHVEASVELAAQAHDPLATAAALHARQLSIAGLGRAAELLDLGDRMLAAAEASGSTTSELLGRGWRIDALLRSGQPAEAAHEVDSLDVLATRSGEPLVRWNALLARAGVDHAVGRFRDAEEQARLARAAMPATQRRQTEPLFVAQLVLIATDRGSEPTEIEVARGFAVGGALIAVAMTGRYDLEMGDPDGARVAFDAIRSRLADVQLDRRGLPTLTAAVELAVAFGNSAVAGDLRDRLAPFDGQMIASSLGAVGPVAYFLGLVDGLVGDHEAAVDHAEAASAVAARGGFGPWLARSRLAHAAALLARNGAGDRDQARQSAMLAAVGAKRLGMRRVVERAESVLDGLADASRLSSREREVATLVAGGASNRDIAESLGLSERTVETHVQNILTKLGFHSRVQIAAWMAAEGGARRERT